MIKKRKPTILPVKLSVVCNPICDIVTILTDHWNRSVVFMGRRKSCPDNELECKNNDSKIVCYERKFILQGLFQYESVRDIILGRASRYFIKIIVRQ